MKKNFYLFIFLVFSIPAAAQHRPTTASMIVRPTTSSAVSHPQTTPAQGVQTRPVTTAEVVQPFTTVAVVHPTTAATPANANAALVQPTKAVAPVPAAKGSKATTPAPAANTSMMSGYKPPQAKDFKAAATASSSSSLVSSQENAPTNANADGARKLQQDLVQGGLKEAAPPSANVNSGSIQNAIVNKVSKGK